MNNRSKVAAAAALACVGVFASVPAMTGTAIADPSPLPTSTSSYTFNGVGSDTTQAVVGALASTVNTALGAKTFASWDATPTGTTISIKPGTAACTIARPNGSGAGRSALLASLNAGDGCLQFARSSSGVTSGANSPTLRWVPLAIDAVAPAVTKSSNVVRGLDLQTLKDAYHCLNDYVPVLPQAGSGTRSFWLTTLGMNDNQGATANADSVINNPCIVNGAVPGTGTPAYRPGTNQPCSYVNNTGCSASPTVWEEHDARPINNDEIFPFSVAQWIAQADGVIAQDNRSTTTLATADDTYPLLLNPSYEFNRTVYNIIPSAKSTDSAYQAVFGATGPLCNSAGDAVVKKYGFVLASNCGDLTTATLVK